MAISQRRLNEMNSLAVSLLERAASALGVAAPRLYYNFEAANAYSDGVSIHYNPQWLSDTMYRFCNDHECTISFALGVFAHELGHHLYGDAYCYGCNPFAMELRADRVAGEVLARNDVTSAHFERILSALSARPTATHPGAHARASSIRTGFDSAQYSALFRLF